MGSPDKFSISILRGFGLGIYVDRFPHTVSININLVVFNIYLGFGRGYDE